jgi:hypothetical protein
MDLGEGKGLVDDVSTRIGSCSESASTEADWGDITDLEKAAKKAEKRRRQKEEKRAKEKKNPVSMTGQDPMDIKVESYVWPLVKCSTAVCNTVTKFSRMWNIWDDQLNDGDGDWTRFCFRCTADKKSITESEARSFIMENAPGAASKRSRMTAFHDAITNVQQSFPFVRGGRQREIALSTMTELFAPLASFIARKRAALCIEVKNMEEHDRLAKQLAETTSAEEAAELITAIEALAEPEKDLAFVGKEDAERLRRAATYSDEWVSIKDTQGRCRGMLRSWYCCCAQYGDQTRCLNVIPSKRWDTKHADPLAARQAWCCTASGCGARFKGAWGQLLQLSLPTGPGGALQHYFCKASCPPWAVEDVRGMYLDSIHDPTSGDELYSTLASLSPETGDVVMLRDDGTTRIASWSTWEGLKEFKWWQIFNFLGLEAPMYSKKKSCKDADF